MLKFICFSLLVFLSLRFIEWTVFSYFYKHQHGYSANDSQKVYKSKQDTEFRKRIYKNNYRRIKNNYEINCSKIIDGDKDEIIKSRERMNNPKYIREKLNAKFYSNITKSCDVFRHERGYINHPLSEDELKFPIAFSILTYREIELTERLLRLIYRPHNYYCIHVDPKMTESGQNALRSIANCLTNVFIANELIDVQWGGMSLLEAEISCMRTLWPYTEWKYYLNLAGQEFPLKTNRQIVAILKELQGANVVDGSALRAKTAYAKRFLGATSEPPHNIQLAKGSMHIAANRYFVDFVLHDQKSLDFLSWLQQTDIPDETYFPSLNHNPHLQINGSFVGEAEEYDLKPFFLRYTVWEDQKYKQCKGKFVREVCIIGVEDLQRSYNGVALFVNKLHLNFEPLSLDCLEEVLYEKTWTEYLKDLPVDINYYRALDYAKLQLKLL